MSLFDNPEFQWRETYFVYFDSSRRPSLEQVRQALLSTNERFEVEKENATSEGGFESITVLAHSDFAALDISYLEGPDVAEEGENLVEELQGIINEAGDREKLLRIPQCNARLDIMHFEQLTAADPEDMDEMFDPSSLLLALETLTRLTEGIGVDPQSGTVL